MNSSKQTIAILLLIAIFGHFIDGWTNPSYSTTTGWWLWHTVNWLRRDVVLVILLWPLVTNCAKGNIRLTILLWVFVGLLNLSLHWILYDLAYNLRFLLN